MPTERCTPSAVGSCARATRPAIRTKARGSFAHSGAGHGTVALRAGTVVETCDEKKQGGKQYNDHEIGDESARDQLACDDDADARDDGCDRDAPPPKISSKERCQPFPFTARGPFRGLAQATVTLIISAMRVRGVVIGAALAASVIVPLAVAQPQAAPPVTSLRNLAPPAKLPADYVRDIGRMASQVGITRTTAVRRTRLLLSDVTGLPLYAFAGTNGRVCYVVWRGGGSCGEINATKNVLWLVNGGSRKRGQAVVGVVSDGVRAVDVTTRARTVRVSVRHNAFVVPFRTAKGERMPQPSVVPVTR